MTVDCNGRARLLNKIYIRSYLVLIKVIPREIKRVDRIVR